MPCKDKHALDFYGGPLDGKLINAHVIDIPGKLPFFCHDTKRQRYVYQGRTFLGDVGETLIMDFVQILGIEETPYDD